MKELSLDTIMQNCPQVLIKLYPLICERVVKYQDTPDAERKELSPLIILVRGSRGSGKSEWAQRMSIAGIYDGYFRNVRYATMTENGLNGSKDAFERLEPNCIGTGTDASKTEPMNRIIGNGRVDFDFFGKKDVKNEQKKYDVLICEEVEKWDRHQGVSALETQIRHCSVIILISNNPPQAVIDFCKIHDALFVECNYWDNHMLPEYLRKQYDEAKLKNPAYYYNYVLCSNETSMPRWFSPSLIELFFYHKNISINLNEVEYSVLGIDVGAGTGGDDSCIALAQQSKQKHIYISILGKYQLEALQLSGEVAKQRAISRANEEVWDAQGIGLSVMQTRAPDIIQRQALGVIPFNNSLTADEKYFNVRSEAYGIWQDFLSKGMIHYIGDSIYVEQLKNEMYAQMYADNLQSKGTLRIAEKKEIKKVLQGESPNLCDAISMAIWRIVKRPLLTNIKQTIFNIKGVPTL